MFLLMGIPCLIEVFFFAYDDDDESLLWYYIWYIVYSIHTLRAIFIFVLFCCKKKVWLETKKVAPFLDGFENFVLTSLHRTRSLDTHMEEIGTVSTTPGHSESAMNDSFYVASEPSENRQKMKVI